jgi:hypothetical protein
VVLVGILRMSDPNDSSREWDTRNTVVLNLRTFLGIPWYTQVYLGGISLVYRVYLVSHFDTIFRVALLTRSPFTGLTSYPILVQNCS